MLHLRGNWVFSFVIGVCLVTPLVWVGSAASDSGSKRRAYHLNHANIQVDVPAGWQDAEYLLNAPLTLLGPPRNGIRPVINFLPTGLKSRASDADAFRADQSSWRSGREAFLKEKGATLQEFYPYREESWSAGVRAHILGYRYQLGEAVIVSRTYYVECKEHYFLVKSVIRAVDESEFEPVVERAMRTFGCD